MQNQDPRGLFSERPAAGGQTKDKSDNVLGGVQGELSACGKGFQTHVRTPRVAKALNLQDDPITCPWVSPGGFPGSNRTANPKSASTAVKSFFSNTFLLLKSLWPDRKGKERRVHSTAPAAWEQPRQRLRRFRGQWRRLWLREALLLATKWPV